MRCSKQILEWRSAVRSHSKSCEHNASVRLDLCLTASCESLYVSVYRFDETIALMTCFRRKSQHCSRLSLARKFSAHINDTDLFVALYNHWIEETVGLELTQNFLRQLLISAFPRAHEADHCSTARFHERDAWLSFALGHRPYEHVVRLELRQGCLRSCSPQLVGGENFVLDSQRRMGTNL